MKTLLFMTQVDSLVDFSQGNRWSYYTIPFLCYKVQFNVLAVIEYL